MILAHPLYMVLTHRSRSCSTRHYRLITANGQHIDDVTALVCRTIGHQWDNERGTYNVRGSMRSQDASDLASKLRVDVSML